MTDSHTFDLLIVGGGANGAGIARDAAGRGLSVALCEQGDLANYTSSASTKLIHGGLRYLEQYEFGLVRKALQERELLIGIAPHVIQPMRFVLPHVSQLRPFWMMHAGMLLYDRLGGRGRLARSEAIDLSQHPAGTPLDPGLRKGFAYSDCCVQDARLVVLNTVDAAERGATIWPRTRCRSAARERASWRVTLQSAHDGREREVRARALVNAAGPWAGRFLDEVIDGKAEHGVALVKGSHIIVPRLFEHDYAYVLQHTDRRVIFAIPYERDFTLIGTTDVRHEGDPAAAEITDAEIDYLRAAVNRYLVDPISPQDVVSSYAGVRPLHGATEGGNVSTFSRDYALRLDTDGAPLLSVLGGKLTTYRRLGREALDALQPHLGGSTRDWTGTTPLPGGDVTGGDFQTWLAQVQQRYPWLPEETACRLARQYGTRMLTMLGDARHAQQLGRCFGADLYEAEVCYLMDREWALSADDVLWRRTKLGLRVSESERTTLADWMQERATTK